MKLASTRELFLYWNALRRSRSAPDRAEFFPTAVRDALADMFILEFDAAGRFPVRMAGTRLEALLGPLENRSFLDLWPAHVARRDVAELLRGVADETQPVVAGVRARAPDGSPLEFELLLLPMREAGRTHACMIGSLATSALPDWRALPGVRLDALTTLRIVLPDGPIAAASERRSPSRRGHLLVYEGGKA